jgi:hypothetical protein
LACATAANFARVAEMNFSGSISTPSAPIVIGAAAPMTLCECMYSGAFEHIAMMTPALQAPPSASAKLRGPMYETIFRPAS